MAVVPARRTFTARFIVGTPDGPRSSTWRVWVPRGKSDVYVAQRGLGTQLKASLHASGECRVAFTSSFAAEQRAQGNWSERPREIDVWSRPKIGPGTYLPFRLIVPWFAVQSKRQVVRPAPIHCIPAPQEGEHVEVAILIVDPAVHVAGWPGRSSMGTKLISRHGLADGSTLFLVHRTEPLNSALAAELEPYRSGVLRGRLRWQAKPVPAGEGSINMILIGANPSDPSRYFLEVPLEPNH